jgi:hypothetical protein
LKGPRKSILYFSVTFVTVILGIQLFASVAWAADTANLGPSVTIIQLSQDEDSDWAVADLQDRLSEFIYDDPFFSDRITVIRTDDPYIAESIKENIIIYVSHGGPLGIVTGKHITSWSRMAQIVENSHASIHLFASCSSRNIIRHGNEDSDKQLYTVPGARPAEVTNVEITTTVMLAFGFDPDDVSEYRTRELTQAKELIQSGQSVHIMDFEEIILSEIENIDGNYSDTYTSDFMVYREAVELTYDIPGDLSELPSDLVEYILFYYRTYIDSDGIEGIRTLESLDITYVKNYYINSTYYSEEMGGEGFPYYYNPTFEQDEAYSELYNMIMMMSGGYWVNSTPEFTGGTYSGWLVYAGDGHEYEEVLVNVTASGPALDANNKTIVDSISLNQIDAGGIYVQLQKVEGEWQEPVVGRNPYRTGGSWTDPAVKADYEYDENWPPYSEYNYQSYGELNVGDGYLYVDSIPTGTGTHGPSFVRTLPSYFRTRDLGSFSVNLTVNHGNNGYRRTQTCVCLYDTNMKIVALLMVYDQLYGSGSSYEAVKYIARYVLKDGSYEQLYSTAYTYGDTSGIVQIRFDPHQGVFGNIPDEDETLLYKWTEIDSERIIQYVVIQSYRYYSNPIHDARIYSINVNYAGSDYTLFHDNCNDMDEFHKDLDFGYGTSSDGNFTVPSGESYMTATDIPSGTGWHGPDFVHVLDRPFRLSQLSEFSVIGEMVQSSSSLMGKTHVALFDENKQIALLIYFGDSWAGVTKGYFTACFYPQEGGSYSLGTDYIYTSFKRTAKLWWGSYPGDEGSIFASVEGVDGFTKLAECDNASRVIKYAVLLGYRYSGYTLADMRIHDIYVEADLKWSQHVVALLDECNDVDNFESDPDFGWGTVTDGELIVPQGESYMTPDDIPDSPAGWHGLNYVHEIETPFILHDLRLFYIQAELFQWYDQMGLIEVALFDANKEIVLNIYWGDSWGSQNKGYFHVKYYPEGGSPVADSTGYIYNNFWRMGELKVEDGYITYEISDHGGTIQEGDLGEVTNPFRMVKYLVIRAQRYSAYDLIDQRLHTIGLYAGQDTSVEEPEESDGSSEGLVPSSAAITFMDLIVDMVTSSMMSWWTGWWPTLHTKTNGTLESGATYEYQTSVDLLGAVSLEIFTIDTPLDDELSDNDIETIAASGIIEFLSLALLPERILYITAIGIMFLINLLLYRLTTLPTLIDLAVLAILIASYAAAMLGALYLTWDGLVSGRLSSFGVFGLLATVVATIVTSSYWDWLNAGTIFAKWWYMRGLWWGTGFRAKGICGLSILIVFVKMFVLGVIAAMMIRAWELYLIGY